MAAELTQVGRFPPDGGKVDSDNAGKGNKAERLTQLAELHRQGVLGDKEFEAAVARVSKDATSLRPRPDHQGGSVGKQLDQSMTVIGREFKRMAGAGVAQLRQVQQRVGTGGGP